MFGELDIQSLINDAIREIVRRAIEQAIGERDGSAIQGDIKDAIKAQAAQILQEPEMQLAIRERIKHWIKTQ